MKQTKIDRIASIEILRFFSSLMILIWHYQHFFNPYNIFSEIEVLKEIDILSVMPANELPALSSKAVASI